MTFHHSHFVPGDKAKKPLLLLHGTGADEFDLIPLARQITPDAPLFSVRGNVVEHGQKRYFRRHEDGSFNQEDLLQRTHELADFVQGDCAWAWHRSIAPAGPGFFQWRQYRQQPVFPPPGNFIRWHAAARHEARLCPTGSCL